jgi:hypothetical protein
MMIVSFGFMVQKVRCHNELTSYDLTDAAFGFAAGRKQASTEESGGLL